MILCPGCGEEEMREWNAGIYECSNCGIMIPIEDLNDLYNVDESIE